MTPLDVGMENWTFSYNPALQIGRKVGCDCEWPKKNTLSIVIHGDGIIIWWSEDLIDGAMHRSNLVANLLFVATVDVWKG